MFTSESRTTVFHVASRAASSVERDDFEANGMCCCQGCVFGSESNTRWEDHS